MKFFNNKKQEEPVQTSTAGLKITENETFKKMAEELYKYDYMLLSAFIDGKTQLQLNMTNLKKNKYTPNISVDDNQIHITVNTPSGALTYEEFTAFNKEMILAYNASKVVKKYIDSKEIWNLAHMA